MSDPQHSVQQLIKKLALPKEAQANFERYWWPLAKRLAQVDKPMVLGISGAQGSGKSTLATALQILLGQTFGLQVATLSLDDLYFPLSHRRWLAQHIHPLLRTRGVPGTHDITLGLELIRRLRQGHDLTLPRFDKASDDRRLEGEWLQGPVDLVIFEGWCLGASAQNDAALEQPVNALEAEQDADGRWRHHVNQCLAGPYQRLFGQMDMLIQLKAPNWQAVTRWRKEQEQALIAMQGKGMDEAELSRFLLHYQRITEHQLRHSPANAIIYRLDEQRQVTDMQQGGKPDYVI
ncbi:hypothetical protein P2G88_10350 [Aliiglaciecola sp. CAU 1673]|uniref:hypothetical protein n=1 Tax=Aliiglaciecola sp. CAU 1673 TaxID=3032595 RepID=UPI0023DBA3E7|nr:hypothetical protein [Aliiglaciecola sp. CAU 1673]MDF2178649.1 hypothetical protein [Aliiglaciecola sp. CAU 1673]